MLFVRMPRWQMLRPIRWAVALLLLGFASLAGAVVGGEGEGGAAFLAGFYRNEEGVIANVLDKNGNQRLLKLVLLVKVKDPELDKAKVQNLWPEISQEIMFMVGEYRIEKLVSPEAKEEFRQQLIKLLQELCKKAYKDAEIVQDILFEEFVYQ